MEEERDFDTNTFNLNKEKRIKIIIVVVAIIITIGFSIFFFWRENQMKKERDVYYAQMEEEMASLTEEKQQLENELSKLKKDYNNTKGISSVVLLFTDLNENIYTDIYPLMKESGFVGTLTISPTIFPGQENCLSLEQFKELLTAGWQCCLKWDDSADLDQWLKSCKEVVKNAGIELPDAVYFPKNSYQKIYDDILKKQGILAVVHHGEEDLPIIISESENDIWHPGAVPWNRSKASSVLSNAINQKGNIVYTIGSDSQQEVYKKSRFASMLKKIDSFSKSNNTFVTTILGAREYRKEIENKLNNLEGEYQTQADLLENKIAEIDKKIDSVYDKYIK